jgi:DNA-binding PadR family transcriptional regulator
MSAKYAALGMLREGPAYSYELAARITGLLGPGYEINSGQMSRILRDLRDGGLVVARSEPSPRGKADDRRIIHAITDEGRADFEKFFEAAPNAARLFRRSLLVKIALADSGRLEEILSQIDTYEQDCTNRVNELIRALDGILPDDQLRPNAERVVLRLGLEADISQLRAELAWARHARQMVSWLVHSNPIWPSTQRDTSSSGESTKARRDKARESILGRLAARERDT